MIQPVPVQARRLAGRLVDAFGSDQQLAERQKEALGRLRAANEQLWSGVHPDGLGLLYDGAAAAAGLGRGSRVAGVLADARRAGADDEQVEVIVLQVVQEIHWAIHHAAGDYQTISEDRRHLAAEIGELSAQLVAELGTVGWSESQVRAADVHQLAERPAAAATPIR